MSAIFREFNGPSEADAIPSSGLSPVIQERSTSKLRYSVLKIELGASVYEDAVEDGFTIVQQSSLGATSNISEYDREVHEGNSVPDFLKSPVSDTIRTPVGIHRNNSKNWESVMIPQLSLGTPKGERKRAQAISFNVDQETMKRPYQSNARSASDAGILSNDTKPNPPRGFQRTNEDKAWTPSPLTKSEALVSPPTTPVSDRKDPSSNPKQKRDFNKFGLFKPRSFDNSSGLFKKISHMTKLPE
uniref:Uncharacterized protein n=1 Tax=Timspurckia oligopyrenoides TaxID=708627 RepID=A0A7S1ER52_9RHOD|mmetsp:Transcript_13420/g.24075  ORF Transcript_13420/g.24075 Transcript_13420/m.24075 type:complete len:244 (+) Transcript_13420:105-836(+)